MRTLFVLILCLLAGISVWAQQDDISYVKLDSNSNRIELYKSMEVLEDKSNDLTFNEIIDNRSSLRFCGTNGKVPNFNYTSSTIWLRFRCQNVTQDTLLRYLEFESYLLNEVEWYQADAEGKYHKTAWGTNNFNIPNSVPATNLVYKFHFPPGKSPYIYAKIKSRFVIMLPIYLWNPEYYWQNHSGKLIFIFSICGILTFAVVFNLFLYIGLRNIYYLYYFLSIFSNILMSLTLDGICFRYLWTDYPDWNVSAVGFFSALSMLFSMCLTISFLELKTQFPRFYKFILYFFIPIFIIESIGNLIGNTFIISLGSFIPIPYLMVTITIAILCVSKGNRSAGYYLSSWIWLLAGVACTVLVAEGVLPYNFFLSHAVEMGTAVEVLLISFALSDRYHMINQENARTQTSLLSAMAENTKLIQEQNEVLEQKVEERTRELAETNEEIATQNTQLAAQRDQLETAYHKLKELDEFKEAMSGMIVHDLKNPLSAIIGISNKDHITKNDQTVIRQAGKQMLNLTLNILDVQKFEQAEVRLNRRDEALTEIVQDAFDQVSLLASNKNQQLSISFEPTTGVNADFELISRVLMNLLTNAIKYTPNNGKITIGAEEMPDNQVKISVADTGQGIPADKLDSVFDKFSQVEAKKSGGARSTGLGLTFCKMTVEAHGGRIWVESVVGVGTIFYFTLAKAVAEIKAVETIIIPHYEQRQISLTEEDLKILTPFLENLRKLDVYEAGDVLKILAQIPDAPNLAAWKSEMESTLFASNQERYAELVQMA